MKRKLYAVEELHKGFNLNALLLTNTKDVRFMVDEQIEYDVYFIWNDLWNASDSQG